MKKLILAVTALLMSCAPVFAQQEINGDLNHDGKIDVTDLAAMSNTILGNKDIEYFDVNKVDNSLIQGPWYLTKSNYITFNADGTTDYLGAYKYEYMPYKSQIILYNSDGSVAKVVTVLKLTSEVLILAQDGTTYTTYYRSQPAQPVTGIMLSSKSLRMKRNATSTLTATISPADADNQEVIWTSSDENVATVANGVVTGVNYGKTSIIAKATGAADMADTCEVEVYGLVTSIQLSDTVLTLAPNSFKTLTVTVLPSDADNPAYTWSSSNEAVAQVTSSGMVLAMAYGKATIKATATDGSGVVGKCELTVKNSASSLKTYTVNGVSFNMVSVKGGTFQMGATEERGSDVESDESPVHSVTLSDYYIGETEVTQALWYAVMGAKPSSSNSWSITYGLGDDYPAYYISYTECQGFITKLNALTGETFRMPTEAEWEYAARGGANSQGYKYAGSNTIDDVAWYYDNSCSKGRSDPDYGTHAVATKVPNELGLYDMSGNVYEWCADWYGSYSSDSQTNPTGASGGSSRVSRGGCWTLNASYCRVSSRRNFSPSFQYFGLGLRLVR